MTQCVKPRGSGASGSWQMSANSFVPLGAPIHCSAGETFSPTPVCLSGMRPCDRNAGLTIFNVPILSFIASLLDRQADQANDGFAQCVDVERVDRKSNSL